MTDQEILKGAPKGATHYECGEYMRNICDDEWEYWSKIGGWQDTHPESETRLLTDIRRIVDMEKNRDIRDLEQQAKGIDDGARNCSISIGGDAIVIGETELNDYANELRNQAKSLKDQVTL